MRKNKIEPKFWPNETKPFENKITEEELEVYKKIDRSANLRKRTKTWHHGKLDERDESDKECEISR